MTDDFDFTALQASCDEDVIGELTYHMYCTIQTGGQACDGWCHAGSPESGPGRPCEECVKSSQTKVKELEKQVAALAGVIDLIIPLVPAEGRGKLALVAREFLSGSYDPDA